MTDELQKKVNFAIKLLKGAEQMAAKVGQPVEICYSGGKDSDVILELAKMSGINYRAIYKNTTIDPPGTIKHAMDMGCEVMRPEMNFFQIISKHGLPSRRNRFCCSYLKEYKVLDYAVVGVRREESKKRADRYKEPEMCRVYSKTVKARQYLPLLEWTSQDVADFIAERGIKCHSLYYDEQGTFHPERRLGCVGCPLAYRKHRLNEFKAQPGMIKIYLRGCRVYWDNHPDGKIRTFFNDIYEWLTFDLFCDNMAEFRQKFGANMFDKGIDCRQFLMDYFHIDLPELS